MLMDEILELLPTLAAGHYAMDIRIGLGYTAVLLEDGRCGLAYTLHEQEYESCSVVPEAGTLAGRSVLGLAQYLKSDHQIACAIGLACVNATIDPPEHAIESDILQLLPTEPDDTVGMIGYFGPLVDPLRKRVRALHIFERRSNPELGVLPESATRDLLPSCRVVILSATALLNHTIDGLLDLCQSAQEIALLGPTTPFLPQVFARHGITLLSGLQVVDPQQVLKVVSEAGGTRQFGRAVRKLTLRTRNQKSVT